MRPNSPRSRPRPTRGQAGVALVAALLFSAVGFASLLLSAPWGEAAAAWAEERRERGLARAKTALIGYAASYVDQHPPGPGPGYLPCPDIDGDGSPDAACGRGAFGWLPWRRLGLPPAVGPGERLWYALDDHWRANPHKQVPLNSETAAGLEVDGAAGYAAVVLAPGRPLNRQARGALALEPARYLEGDNAAPGDGRFASRSRGGAEGNDRLLALPARALARAVERRVLAEAARTLASYRRAPWNHHAMLPWLLPTEIAEPSAGVVGARAGRLPVHEGWFPTAFRLHWPDAERFGDPPAGALAGPHGVHVARSDGQCLWTTLDEFTCSGEAGALDAGATGYSVEFALAAPGRIEGPSDADVRRRGAELRGRLPDGTFVRVTRYVARGAPQVFEAGAGDVVDVSVQGVRYALGPGEDLPWWFVDHRWHDLVFAVLEDASDPEGSGCHAPRCVRIRSPGLGVDLERLAPGALIASGPPLGGQLRPSASTAAYLEGRNVALGSLVEVRRFDPGFNDQVRPLGDLALP